MTDNIEQTRSQQETGALRAPIVQAVLVHVEVLAERLQQLCQAHNWKRTASEGWETQRTLQQPQTCLKYLDNNSLSQVIFKSVCFRNCLCCSMSSVYLCCPMLGDYNLQNDI